MFKVIRQKGTAVYGNELVIRIREEDIQNYAKGINGRDLTAVEINQIIEELRGDLVMSVIGFIESKLKSIASKEHVHEVIDLYELMNGIK